MNSSYCDNKNHNNHGAYLGWYITWILTFAIFATITVLGISGIFGYDTEKALVFTVAGSVLSVVSLAGLLYCYMGGSTDPCHLANCTCVGR